MRKLGFKKWLVQLVMAVLKDTKISVRVNEVKSEEFKVMVGFNQWSVPSPLLTF